MELETFAAKLRVPRQKAGLSQEGLAARLGVSAQSVSKWENAALPHKHRDEPGDDLS